MSTKLVPAICTQCGGSVAVDPSQEKAFCSYCGTPFFVEKAIENYNIQHANIERVESMNIHHHKRGAVESVLDFIEKQKKTPEERKQEVKRSLIAAGALSIIILVLLLVSFFILPTIEEQSHEGKVRTPGGSSFHEGRDYNDVVSDFEDSGFTNIETEKLEDLITGWITKDGEVESVSVDFDEDYEENGWYPNDVKVIITYHTFAEKD
jgi:hypothetical protein